MVTGLKLAIPYYNGFATSLNMEQKRSQAYMSYNQPPNKTDVKDVMDKFSIIIDTKCMPFTFLVEDHTVCVVITLLKAENPNKYCAIVPFLGPFHTQRVRINVFYKRYKGSELGDVLRRVIAEGSVNRMLN
jgi:hypothetical protein